jgi:glutamate-1-semialdehyde 2,1-aminomutase
MKEAASAYGIVLQTDVRGSMFGFFFNDAKVMNFDDAAASNLELFAKFHAAMLEEGYYFACSQFETGFICTAITDAMIEETIAASKRVFERIS